MWKQSQPQSRKQCGSMMEARWMQNGSKSMEHARQNGFATEALMPLDGKAGGLLPLDSKSETLLPPTAKTASRRDRRRNHGRLVNSSQSVIGKVMTQPICHHFCHHLPLPRKVYIAGHLGLISLSPLMYYFTFMQATRYIVIHTRDSIS
jgi:hypothetical protein